MRKGVILEINDLYLTLLTPEGEFLKARKLQQDYQVGEEIHFFPESQTVKEKNFNRSFLNSFKARTIALAAAFMLVMTGLVPVYQDGQVYAYMSIDVNPSIELAVNDDLKVLQMEGYNSEGEEIIGNIKDWKKKDAAVVAQMILEEIEEEGFFKDKNEVVIATVHKKKAKETVDRKLEQKISEIKKSTQDALDFKVMEATTEDREKAQKQGVSTGVYKEKQKEKPKPEAKPVEKGKGSNPERVKKVPAPTVVPQQEKKEPPGQIKKKDPVVPPGKPNKTEKTQPEKGNGKKKFDKNYNGQGNKSKNGQSNTSKVVRKDDKINNNQQSRKPYKNEKKPDKQQGPKSDNKGQGKNNGNHGK